MALENLTFFEASEMCGKTYKCKGDYIINGNDFPKLKKNVNSLSSQSKVDTVIEPPQRRAAAFKANTVKRTYQQVLSNNNNKKRAILRNFDKEEHEENLYFPNGRPFGQSSQSQAWITQHFKDSQTMRNPNTIPQNILKPGISAVSSCSNYNPPTDKINLDSIIRFLRNASQTETNVLREILMPNNFMDLDQSESDF